MRQGSASRKAIQLRADTPVAAIAADPPARAARTEPLRGRRVLIIVDNLPCPFDRRVWQEATTLARAGMTVSIICRKGRGVEASREEVDGIVV